MIHDAKVEVTCDGADCFESIDIQLDYVYGGIMGTDGRYNDDDDDINNKVDKQGWTVDGDEHFCSNCAVKR